ncbi:MAG: hypothetical protein K1X88_35800 [Nannocystaceae bacterium]|nr:hypothetical protein [Nannocystaceae bacterium]
MSRIPVAVALLACLALPCGCHTSRRGSTPPAAAADPLAELAGIPEAIDAEIQRALDPIHQVDAVLDRLATMPGRLGIDAASLRTLAFASLRDGRVEVALELPAEARAEVVALLESIRTLGASLRETPGRVAASTKAIAGQGAKAVGLVTQLQSRGKAKLLLPLVSADERARVQSQLAEIARMDAEIKAVVGEAKQTVVGLPARCREALVKLTQALVTG